MVLFQGYINLADEEYTKCLIEKNDMINGCSLMIEEELNETELILKDCDKIIHRFNKNNQKNLDKSLLQKEIYKIVRCFCFYRPDILYSKIISEFAMLFYIICNKNEFDTFVILCNYLINNYNNL